ncbi:endonuclease [Sphingobium sp. H33]|uniref:Endonuclease n=2 Tax=Sphingobium nicotianae TaxID=2782607 RepID=A0A9X1IRS9_9SPHN|nr:endonuclease [Sphingobium nicotianae]
MTIALMTALLPAAAFVAGPASAATKAVPKPMIEHKMGPNANAPIAASVSVPAAANVVYLSGQTASPIDPAKPDELGDTKTQTLSILTKIKAQLEGMGMSMGDIVKMTIFMVGTPETGKMDAASMNEVFRTFFGTAEQPNKPARSTVQVAALGRPPVLIEIEAVAAKMP